MATGKEGELAAAIVQAATLLLKGDNDFHGQAEILGKDIRISGQRIADSLEGIREGLFLIADAMKSIAAAIENHE